MFEPRLWLLRQPNGSYSLLVKTLVPDFCYTAGEALAEPSPDMQFGRHVYPVLLFLNYTYQEGLGNLSEVQHRIAVDVADGDVLAVFVLYENRILGSAEAIIGVTPVDGTLIATDFLKSELGHPPPMLTPAFCQSVIVRATPKPENFSSITQPLLQLGIADISQADTHRESVCRQMESLGYEISVSAVISGPEISISDSRDSLFSNAHLPIRLISEGV